MNRFEPQHLDRESTMMRALRMIVCTSVLVLSMTCIAQEEESTFLTNIRQLIYEGRRSGEGYFSPDGKELIFQSEREPDNPFFQIYLLSLETGDVHRVSPGTGKTTCSFIRPGADQVLFGSTHLDPNAVTKQKEELDFRASGQQRRYSWDYDPYMDIFSARKNGSNIKQLTNAFGYDAEASYSPDGVKIVFCSIRNAYPVDRLSTEDQKRIEVDPSYFGEIYLMNADGSQQTRLTDWPGYDGGPFFSPDGQRIIWRHFDESGMLADVYTMRLDGSDRKRITDFEALSWAPYFHPSGQYILFASNKLGFSNFEVYMVDAEGRKAPVRITYKDGFDGLPVFSPDGKRLVWTSGRTTNGQSQLFMGDWNHKAALAALQTAPARQKGQKVEETTSDVSYAPDIEADDLRTKVTFLASDELEGRMTGTQGTQMAAEYIVSHFKNLGLEPAGDNGSFYQSFNYPAGISADDDKNQVAILDQKGNAQEPLLSMGEDFMPLSLTADGTVEGEVVFVGYGTVTPDEGDEAYDAYGGLDVTDKILLMLNYVPEDVDLDRRQYLNHYSSLRFKAMTAREKGARGVLVVNGPTSLKTGELLSLTNDQGTGNSGIVAVSVSGELADRLFQASGHNLKDIQTQLDMENPHIESSFPLNVRMRLKVTVNREKGTDRNVLALLPPAKETENNNYLMLGAHYDHIGRGEIGSLARAGEEGQIHNGADDNASGTATIMELAEALVQARSEDPTVFSMGVLFALWSGEELGIIGSSHFAENPTVPLENIVAYFNFDMVGQLKENKLILQGVDSSQAWKKIIEKRNIMAGFNLVLQGDPYLPTDVTAFYPKGVPVLAFFTGSHENYNRPTDDADTLNYDGMQRIAKFAYALTQEVMAAPERPDYVKVKRKAEDRDRQVALRAYLGSIPDYVTTDIEGVKLSGVRAGGPAEKAGLQGGDIIIEFAGKKIANIYDYTYVLEAVKIGEPISITVQRQGNTKQLTITPEARQ